MNTSYVNMINPTVITSLYAFIKELIGNYVKTVILPAFMPQKSLSSFWKTDQSFRKTDQSFSSFSETAQKMELLHADYQCYFKNLTKQSYTWRWNFPAFGIEKNGPTYADFEACPKFVFSSFKTQKFMAFLKNWQTFLGQFFFDSPHFFSSKIKKKIDNQFLLKNTFYRR